MFGDTLGLILPSLPWGFQWCDTIQCEWPGWHDILRDAVGGSGKRPLVWEMGISYSVPPQMAFRVFCWDFQAV